MISLYSKDGSPENEDNVKEILPDRPFRLSNNILPYKGLKFLFRCSA
jgi:hypothetical protein